MELINNFDPNMLEVGASFLAVACKYGAFFGIVGTLMSMLIKAFSGKERFM